MASQWYYQVNGKEFGPVSPAELRALARRGTLSGNAQVRSGSNARWTNAMQVQGLREVMPTTDQASSWPPAAAPPPAATVRPVAATEAPAPQAIPEVAAAIEPEPDYERIAAEIADAPRLCRECGVALQENAAICVNCGLDLRTGKKITDQAAIEEETKTPPLRSYLILGASGILVGGALVFIFIGLAGSAADGTGGNTAAAPVVPVPSAAASIRSRSDEAPQPPIVFVDLPPLPGTMAPKPVRDVAAAELKPSVAIDHARDFVRPAGAKAEVEWEGKWYAAEVIANKDGKYHIHYNGYETKWDEWVPRARIRFPGEPGYGILALAVPLPIDAQLEAAWQRDWTAFGEELKQTFNPQTFLGKEVQWSGTLEKFVEKSAGKRIVQLKMPRIDVIPPLIGGYRVSYETVLLDLTSEEIVPWASAQPGQAVTFRGTLRERNADTATTDASGTRVVMVSFTCSGAKLMPGK